MQEPTRPPDTPELRQTLRQYTVEQVEKFNKENGTTYNPKLLVALFGHESNNFNPYAESETGAAGIAQFTTETAKSMGLSPEDRYNPLKAIPAGIAYFHKVASAFPDSVVSQLRAYNAGVKGTQEWNAGIRPQNAARATEIENFPHNVLRTAKRDAYAEIQAAREAPQTSAPSPATTSTLDAATRQDLDTKYGPNRSPGNDVTAVGAFPAIQSLGSSLLNSVRPTLEQFPRDILTPLSTDEANRVMQEQWPPQQGPPPQIPQPFPVIDPMGAVNFLTLPLSGGRVANAGIQAGLGVLNTADSLARTQATKDGVDWSMLPTGDRISRVVDQLNTDGFAKHFSEYSSAAGIGAVLGSLGKKPEVSLMDDMREIWEPGQRALRNARGAYAERVAQIEAQNRRIFGEAWTLHDALDDEYIAKLNATNEQNWQRAINYRNRVEPIEQVVTGAEARTGLRRLPTSPTEFERMNVQRDALARLRTNYRIPAENPAAESFAQLSETTDRPLDAALAARTETAFDEIRAEARRSQRLATELEPLTRRLGDTETVTPQIRNLQRKIELEHELGGRNAPARIARLEAQVRQLEDLRPEPTVNDLIDRVQAIDALRRNKAFRDVVDPRVMDKLRSVRQALRGGEDGTDGLIRDALSPEEYALWVEGNTKARDWRERQRVLQHVTNAFTTTNNGPRAIRNALSKRPEKYIAMFGQENYDSLLTLATDLDTLRMKFPVMPRLEKTPTPPRLEPPKLQEIPEFKAPKMTEQERNLALWKEIRLALNITGTGAYAGMQLANKFFPDADFSTKSYYTTLGGLGLALLLTVPAMRKSFHTFVEASDDIAGQKATRALARMAVAAQIHQSYGEAVQPENVVVAPPRPKPTPPPPRVLPTLPTSRMGGPIPAPPTTAAPGARL